MRASEHHEAMLEEQEVSAGSCAMNYCVEGSARRV